MPAPGFAQLARARSARSPDRSARGEDCYGKMKAGHLEWLDQRWKEVLEARAGAGPVPGRGI